MPPRNNCYLYLSSQSLPALSSLTTGTKKLLNGLNIVLIIWGVITKRSTYISMSEALLLLGRLFVISIQWELGGNVRSTTTNYQQPPEDRIVMHLPQILYLD
jgi:hypothetical protein